MQPCELAAFVTSVACALARNLTDDELSILGAVFTQLGDTLTTIQAQNEICNKRSATTSKVESEEDA